MIRTDVVSSNVKSIGFDAAKALVEVEFKNGGVYEYRNVPAELFDFIAEVRAGYQSAGKFVLRLKREPLIECVKVEAAA